MARFYGRFDLVIARSEVYRRRLIDELRLRPDRVRTLRPGVDTRLFSPTSTREDDYLRLRLAVPDGAKVVLYAGRVTDEKNVGFLADAWRSFSARARRSGPGAVFVVAGGGNLDEFRRRAGPGVQMLGPCDSETLAALYRRADLFWTASTAETLGQVVLEAQACGVPVLVADRGAAGENVVDHSTGRILPVDSPELWAGELKRLLDDHGRRARMAGAARTLAEERTIEASYRHYWELHRELAANCKSGGEAARFSPLPRLCGGWASDVGGASPPGEGVKRPAQGERPLTLPSPPQSRGRGKETPRCARQVPPPFT